MNCGRKLAAFTPNLEIINPGSTTSFFRTSSLWGAADTAPYFHDNSAADLEEVMDRYDFLFAVTAAGLNNPAFILSQQDRDDIIAYMNFAFTRENFLILQ